jgi:hypothetical protein
MLDRWLSSNQRESSSYSDFEVIDVVQTSGPTSEMQSTLINLLRDSRFDPEFLGSMAEHLGWNVVRDSIVAGQMPKLMRIRRGDFGEVLINAILEQFHGYTIPVAKLRFKIIGNQSLPGTDALALKTDNQGAIVEVCFVESKLRTKVDYMAAVEGYKQLQEDYESKLPDILSFIAQRLHERQARLFNAFATYMRTRQDTTEMDTFRLSLCWENSEWREKTLENLQDEGVTLPELTVHLIRIHQLRQLTDTLFAELGVTEVTDDD